MARPPTRKRRTPKPSPTGATKVREPENKAEENEAKRLIAHKDKAKKIRLKWEGSWQECYDYAMPNRRGFNEKEEGANLAVNILDSTAVHAVPEFGSRMKSGTTPAGARWINLKPGRDFDNPKTSIEKRQHKEVQQHLVDIEEDLHESLLDSNYDSEADESFLELAIGTGILRVDDGGLEAPFLFRSIPLSGIYANVGPFGTLDEFFEPITIMAQDILVRWPKAKLSKDLKDIMNDSPMKELTFFECVLRDRKTDSEERYEHRILWEKGKEIIYSDELKGEGSNPYIAFRWSRASGETWGRGPLLYSMGDIKTTNLTIELILENAEKAIAGIWQSDDELINPETINFVPGTIIPKTPGTNGLEPLEAPGRVDMAQLILEDMRRNIKKGLFSEPLGGTEGTPMSATEAAQRLTDLSRIIGSPFGRLVNELVRPVVKRCLYIRRKGGHIKIPRLNNRAIRMKPVSPLARAADQERILQIDRFLEMLMVRFGPQMVNLIVKGEDTAMVLADLFGVKPELIRNEADFKMMADRLQQMSDSPETSGIMGQLLKG